MPLNTAEKYIREAERSLTRTSGQSLYLKRKLEDWFKEKPDEAYKFTPDEAGLFGFDVDEGYEAEIRPDEYQQWLKGQDLSYWQTPKIETQAIEQPELVTEELPGIELPETELPVTWEDLDQEQLRAFEQGEFRYLPQELKADYWNIPVDDWKQRYEDYLATEKKSVSDAFFAVFPEWKKLGEGIVETWFSEFDTNEKYREDFLTLIQGQGKNNDTVNLLKVIYPEITDRQIRGLYGEYIAPLNQLPLDTFNISDQVIDDVREFAIKDPDGLRMSMLYEGRNEKTESLLKDIYGEENITESYLKSYFEETTANKFVRGDWVPEQLEDYWDLAMSGIGDIFRLSSGIADRFGADSLAKELQVIGSYGQVLTKDIEIASPYTPKWFAQNMARMAPMMLGLIGTSVITGGAASGVIASAGGGAFLQAAGGAVASGLLASVGEGAMEAGDAYNEAKSRGMSDEEANSVFDKVLRGNVLGLSASNIAQYGLTFFVPGGKTSSFFVKSLIYGFDVASEGLEEAGQLYITRSALGDAQKFDSEMLQNFVLGASAGLGFAMLGSVNTLIQNKVQGKMEVSEYDQLRQDINTFMGQGLSRKESEMKAWDKYAGTPEGQQKIKEAVKEVQAEETTKVITEIPKIEEELKTLTSQVEVDNTKVNEIVQKYIPKAGVAKPAEAVPQIPKAEVGTAELSDVEIERAANIRLDKYPEEVRVIIKEWAQSHIPEIEKARRGVIPDEQVRAEAERLASETGGDIDKLRKKWKPGKAWNAEEILAIRSVLNQKTREVLNAQKAVKANNSTQNLLKLELALREQSAIQEIVSGVTAEAGRALRSFRQNVFDVLKSSDVERMEEMLKKIGKDRTDLEKIAEMLGKLDPSDPIAVNNFIRELYKPHFFDYVTELYYNSILSGPKTHIVNSLSNTANALLSPIERLVSALVDLPLAKIQGRERARFLDEVPADIAGAWRGIPEGFRQFAYVVKNGISFDQATKWEFRPKAFKGKLGAVIGIPSRLLEAADAMMKAVNQRAALNAEAMRIANKENLHGGLFEERVAELISSPTEDMLREANKIAEYRLFRAPPGKFGQTLMTARDAIDIKGFRPLRFVIPFIRTPYNLVKYGLERTPLGYLNPELWRNLSQKNPEASDQIARATIGSFGLAALATYFAAGMITGSAPRDRAERDRFYREGKQPYAIRVGGFWVSYQRLEPFNQLLSQVSIITDMIRHDDKGVDEKIIDAANTFGQNFISQTYMSSISDLMNMLAEPERYAGNWLNRFASSMFIPMSSATRTAAQMFDDTVRDPDNAWETIEASIPGLSNNVKAKLSTLGEDIKRKSPAWFPVNITPVEETILSQELERLEYDIGFAGATISGVKLTEQEQYDYQILAGQIIKDDLAKLMLDPAYWQGTDTEKHSMIDKVIGAARDWARTKMREKLWGEKAPEERIVDLSAALNSADNQLGKIISAAPDLSNGKHQIYDITHELDSSYRKLLDNIAVGDIPPDAPASVKGWYEKESVLKELNVIPDKRLYEINMTGDVSLENYVTQWQQFNEITDERERQEFIKEYPNYALGNIPRRTLDLLNQYNALDTKEQKQFLIDHPELKVNPQTDWLKSNPKQNALLAIWGDAKILTKEAYDELKRLMVEYDIPDNALPEMVLPPETSLENYFKYQEILENYSSNSWEAQLIIAQDDKLRDFLGRNPIDMPVLALELLVKNRETLDEYELVEDKRQYRIDNVNFADDLRRIEAYQKNADDATANLWVEHGRISDKVSGFQAEEKIWLFEHPEIHKWALDNDLVTDDGTKWNIPALRITTKWREQDAEYDALPTDDGSRAEYLQVNEEYRKDRRRSEAYQKGFPEDMIELFVNYWELPTAGYRRSRMLIENPKLAEVMGVKIPDKVPSVNYDVLLEKPNKTERDLVMMEGYKVYVPDEYINRYADWILLNRKGQPADWLRGESWYEDDWYLIEHPAFYENVYVNQFGLDDYLNAKDKDGVAYKDKVPSRDVWKKYVEYLKIETTKDKDDFRWNNRDLDKWLFDSGKVTMTIDKKKKKSQLTPRERAEELAREAEESIVRK